MWNRLTCSDQEVVMAWAQVCEWPDDLLRPLVFLVYPRMSFLVGVVSAESGERGISLHVLALKDLGWAGWCDSWLAPQNRVHLTTVVS